MSNNNNYYYLFTLSSLTLSEANYRSTLGYHGIAFSLFTYNFISFIVLTICFLLCLNIFLNSVYVFYLLFSIFSCK